MFRQDFTCPALLEDQTVNLPVRGYHPLRPAFPGRFRFGFEKHWPNPRSLATTSGVSVDVLSSRYLDVSVPWVRFKPLWIQGSIPSSDPPSCNHTIADALTRQRVEGGFPHSEILGSKLVRSSPRLIAAYHVLHRLSAPRHPPDALTTLDYSHDRCPQALGKEGGHDHQRKTCLRDFSQDIILLAKHIRRTRLRAVAGSRD